MNVVAPTWIYSWWAMMSPDDWQHVRWQLIQDDGGVPREIEQRALMNIRNKAHIAAKLRIAYDYVDVE